MKVVLRSAASGAPRGAARGQGVARARRLAQTGASLVKGMLRRPSAETRRSSAPRQFGRAAEDRDATNTTWSSR
jgi:hypothetical protein